MKEDNDLVGGRKVTYEDYIRQRQRENRIAETTRTVNALAGLGVTAGGALSIAGNRDVGYPTLAGTIGAAGGYHIAKLFGMSPGVALLVAGISGPAAGATFAYARSRNSANA